MKKHVFTVSPLPAGKAWSVRLPDLVHQMVRVLHLRVGEEVLFVDGEGGRIGGEVVGYTDRSVEVRLTPVDLEPGTGQRVPEKRPRLFVCAAILKKDHFEWLTEKLAEIGVTDLLPLVSARTIKKDVRLERLQTIAREAMEQSEQAEAMAIHPPTDLAGAVRQLQRAAIKALVCDTKKGLPDLGAALRLQDARAVFVGPEGGWSEEERAFFDQECRFSSASLGPSILRGETAGILAGYVLAGIVR